jgi:hypothetical protein
MCTVDVPSTEKKKPALPKMLCQKVHCYEAKSTCLVKHLLSFNACAGISVPKLEDRMTG